MTRAWRYCRIIALGLTAALAACSSTEPVLYTVAPVEGVAHNAGPRVVVLRQIVIERYLDRPEIVHSSEDYRLNVMANDWWGEPLAAMLNRVLIVNLSQRLPQSTVLSETGAVSSAPDSTVEVNVQRLDEDAAGSVMLQAQVAVSVKGQKDSTFHTFRYVVAPRAAGVSGQVAATSTALGRLADGIAAMLLAAPALR